MYINLILINRYYNLIKTHVQHSLNLTDFKFLFNNNIFSNTIPLLFIFCYIIMFNNCTVIILLTIVDATIIKKLVE